jgi:hypothetical protein
MPAGTCRLNMRRRRTLPLKVAVSCGMLLLEGYDAHADSIESAQPEANPGYLGSAGEATIKYQDQVYC